MVLDLLLGLLEVCALECVLASPLPVVVFAMLAELSARPPQTALPLVALAAGVQPFDASGMAAAWVGRIGAAAGLACPLAFAFAWGR